MNTALNAAERPIQSLTASRRHRTLRRGSTIVETALVLPFILLLLFGILEYGRYLMIQHVVNNAAREGCRYALAHTQPITISSTTTGNTTTDVTNKVSSFLAGLSLSSQNVQVYMSDSVGNNTGVWTNTKFGQYICVQITGNFNVITPTLLFMPGTIPVTVRAVMRSEAN